jgi:hypothetical protein
MMPSIGSSLLCTVSFKEMFSGLERRQNKGTTLILRSGGPDNLDRQRIPKYYMKIFLKFSDVLELIWHSMRDFSKK